MNKKSIFRSSSTTSFFSFYLANIAGLLLIGYLSLHFNQNPPVIGALMFITAAVICINSRKTCVVMDDRFTIVYTRFIPLLSTSKYFFYNEIDSIDAILPLTRSTETGLISTFLSYRYSLKSSLKNTLTFHFHDGRVKYLSVTISREDLQEAFRHIRTLSSIRIAESY